MVKDVTRIVISIFEVVSYFHDLDVYFVYINMVGIYPLRLIILDFPDLNTCCKTYLFTSKVILVKGST